MQGSRIHRDASRLAALGLAAFLVAFGAAAVIVRLFSAVGL